MTNTIKGIIGTLLIGILLTGCGSTPPPEPLTPEQIQNNFNKLADQLADDPGSASYLKLYSQYLLTEQPLATIASYNQYLAIDAQLQNNTLSCSEVNWREITRADFWSIEPHMAALDCYEQLGNTKEAERYSHIINFLLEGIINSGDGKHAWSAYEIATWADANKIVELLEYEVIDEYLHFNQQNSLVYKVYLANNPETGLQEEVWFENNRFLHRILGIQYPFAGVDNSLFTAISEGFGSYYAGAQIGLAKQMLSEQSTRKEAFELLIKAVEAGSAVANFELGWACLKYEQDIYNKDNCIEFLIAAAESGVLEAHVVLALQHYEGFYSEQDNTFADELMAAVTPQLEPGKAQHLLAVRYRDLDHEKYQEQYRQHLNLAAEQDYMRAKEFLWQMKASEKSEKDDVETLWQELKEYAIQGSAYAAARYANYINYNDNATKSEKDEAKALLLSATKTNLPYAHYVVGRMYERGKLTAPNKLDAFLAYQQAAIRGHAVSQLQVGYYNDVGTAVEVNKALALNWYFLCSKSLNSTCLSNVGIYYREGIAIEKNPELAKTFFELSSRLGNTNAMVHLGKLYDFSTGLYANKPKANEYYLAACEKNNGEGCHYHAISLEEGDGIPTDVKKASNYYEKACSLSYGASCYRYGKLFWEGESFEQNQELALQYLTKGCELQTGEACMILAKAYFDGNGVKKDIDRAGLYRIKACQANFKICYQLLD